MFIKAYFKKQTHLISIKSVPNLSVLNSLVKTLFSNLPNPFLLQAHISDQIININSNEDIDKLRNSHEYFVKVVIEDPRILQQKERQLLESLRSQNKQLKKQQQKAKYLEPPSFQCKVCENVHNGIIYRCSVCSNFEMCQDCETLYEHIHPLLKIKKNEHMKIKIFAILADELPIDEQGTVKQNSKLNAKKKQEGKQKKGWVNKIAQVTSSSLGFFGKLYKKQNRKTNEKISKDFVCQQSTSSNTIDQNLKGKISQVKKSHEQEVKSSDAHE